MTSIVFLQIEAVPFIALGLIFHISLKDTSGKKSLYKFRSLVLLVMAILLVDCINWHMLVNKSEPNLPYMWLFNIVYFLLSEIIAYNWFAYVYNEIHEGQFGKKEKRVMLISKIPLIIICLIIITAPFNNLIFFIDPKNLTYHRGALHLLQESFGFGYMAVASILAYIQSRKAQLTDQKKEYRFLSAIVILPFVGGILQLINFYIVFLWPFTAAAAFLIYVDFQSHQIYIDVLTSLNNRGSLERFLQKKQRSHETGWYYIMMDIDRFKSINDTYGHIEGDRALKTVAQALKNEFGKSNSFTSRFGGDEFVVVADFSSQNELEAAIDRCRNDIRHQEIERKLLLNIEISVGYAQYDEQSGDSIKDIMKKADMEMYRQKNKKAEIN